MAIYSLCKGFYVTRMMPDKMIKIVSLSARCLYCSRKDINEISSKIRASHNSASESVANEATVVVNNTIFSKRKENCLYNNEHLSFAGNGSSFKYRSFVYGPFSLYQNKCTTTSSTSSSRSMPILMSLHHLKSSLNLSCFSKPYTKMYSTGNHAISRPGLLSRIWMKIGPKKLRYKTGTLNRSGYRLYCCIDEFVDYNIFIKELGISDTFASWFLVMELHSWMVMVRLSTEGQEGNIIRQSFLKAMWSDVETRSKKLGSDATERKKGIKELSDMFLAGIFAYDEGFLSDDKTLAASVWRIMYTMECEDPEKVELVVHYIRKQVKHLENQSSELMLRNGILSFLPLNSEKMDPEYENKTIARAIGR